MSKKFGLIYILILSFIGLSAYAQNIPGTKTSLNRTYFANSLSSLSNILWNVPNNSYVYLQPGTYAVQSTPPQLNASSGSVGSYNVPLLLYRKTNVNVIAYGAEITGPGIGVYYCMSECENVGLFGAKFNLSRVYDGTTPTAILRYSGTVQFNSTGRRAFIEKCTLINGADQGVTSSRLWNDVTVRDNEFYNIGCTNVQYVNSSVPPPYVDGTAVSGIWSGWNVDGNRMFDCFRGVEWDEVTSATSPCNNIIVQNNFITNCLHVGIFSYSANSGYAGNLTGLKIIGNFIHQNTNASVSIDSRLDSNQRSYGIDVEAGSNVDIARNTVVNVYNTGIRIASSSPIEGVNVSDNIVVGCGQIGGNRGISIECSSTGFRTDMIRNVNVTGNNVSQTGTTSIWLTGAGVNVYGNTIWRPGDQSGQIGYAFLAASTSPASGSWVMTNIMIRANSVYTDKASSFPYFLGVGSSGTPLVNKVYVTADNLMGGLQGSPLTAGASQASGIWWEHKGTSTLVAGTVTVSDPFIKAGNRIIPVRRATGGTVGHLSYTIVAGTSFTINSSSAAETSTIDWLVLDDR